jgi:ESCRT-II complex subunit VPS36
MFLQPLDLTTALRPSLLPEEVLLFVQDAVGLYEGCEMLPRIIDDIDRPPFDNSWLTATSSQ